MIRIKNVKKIDGTKEDFSFPSTQETILDGSSLTALPALFDPHVHFRIPGDSHKEDWKTASFAALFGGVTFVCDMPNNKPSCTTVERLRAKKKMIDAELHSVGIPLNYGLYLGADKDHIDEIAKAKGEAIGVKLFMGGSTGDLLVDQLKDQEAIFREVGQTGMLMAVHAEDEALLQKRKKAFENHHDVSSHSQIRNTEVAKVAVQRAIDLAAKHNVRLYLLHLSTKEELDLVRQAKKSGVKVYAETTPHHLFLSIEDYPTLGTLVQMNPPLRTKEDQEYVWEAIGDGTIDTIGTDHAPHTLEEKKQSYGKAPSGIPGIDTYLPLLLNALNEKRLTLPRLIELTRTNALKMFGLPENNDLVLVDLNLQKTLSPSDIKTKCNWSPYMGRELKGWPLYTVLKGTLFSHRRAQEKSLSSDCQSGDHCREPKPLSQRKQSDAIL